MFSNYKVNDKQVSVICITAYCDFVAGNKVSYVAKASNCGGRKT